VSRAKRDVVSCGGNRREPPAPVSPVVRRPILGLNCWRHHGDKDRAGPVTQPELPLSLLGDAFDLPHADVHTAALPHVAAFNAPAGPALTSSRGGSHPARGEAHSGGRPT
jgi:hypothetical protein